jgi:hypothetical protein
MDVESCLAPRPINPSKPLENPTCGVAQAYKPKLTCSAVTPWALISQYDGADTEDERGPLLGADILLRAWLAMSLCRLRRLTRWFPLVPAHPPRAAAVEKISQDMK